jgi:catechol 2,3-dioxygenase-like lactoylglutathione lyase family enzyme
MSDTTTSILRTAFCVSSVERALSFYRDLLGLRLVRDRVREGESYERLLGIPGVRLRVALVEDPQGRLLELIEYLNPRAESLEPVTSPRLGAADMCFVVPDVDALYASIRAAGCNAIGAPSDFVQEGRVVGRIVKVFDPDGIPVVLLQKIEPR